MGTARAAAAEFPMVAVHRTDRGSGPAWQARRGQELHPTIAGQASKHFNSICARNPPVRRHGKLRALSRWPPHGRAARLSAPLSTQSVLQCPDFVQVVRRWRRWVNHLWTAMWLRFPEARRSVTTRARASPAPSDPPVHAGGPYLGECKSP